MTGRTESLIAIAPEPIGPDRPLVLFLHGYGADERDLAPLAAALPADFAWASLRAPLALPQGGRAWFPIERVPVTSGDEPPADALREATAALLAWIEGNVPAQAPIVPLGFSQGGLMATRLLRVRPERFAAAVVLSGFVAPGREEGDRRLAELRPPLLFGYGEADPVIEPGVFAAAERLLSELVELELVRRPGLGHGIDPVELDAVRAFLERLGPAVLPEGSALRD